MINTKLELRVFGEPMQYRTPDTRLLADRKGRLIPNRKTGKPWTVVQHPDTRVVKWQEEIREQVKPQIAGKYADANLPLTGPLNLTLWVFVSRPKTVTAMYPDTRPDRTNYLKAAEDPFDGLVWKDDGQIVTGPIYLRWAYYNYPECGPRKPGLIFVVNKVNTDNRLKLNAEYRKYLKDHNLEYQTVLVGRKKVKKVVLAERW